MFKKTLAAIILDIFKSNENKEISTQFILNKIYKINKKLIPWRDNRKRMLITNFEDVPPESFKNGKVNQTFVDNMYLYAYFNFLIKKGLVIKTGSATWKYVNNNKGDK